MLRRIGVTALVLGALAPGQTPLPPGMMPQNGANSSNGNSNNSSGNPSGRIRAASGDTTRENSPLGEVSGRAVLEGAGEPAADILIQRVCGNAVIGETRTDSSGRFFLARIGNHEPGVDVANSASAALWGCEVRATAAGYHNGSIPLGNGRASDGSEMVLVLRPVGATGRMTISATTLLAPKNARKSYDKGLEAIRHNLPDLAQKEFGEATRVYPRFAAAWFELGKVYEQREHLAQAREAYAKAIAADGEYLFPYTRLYRLDARESRWKDAADASSKVLRLDPYEFPEAYYFNAISNFQLNDLDAAERSAREAAKKEGLAADPRGTYVLGLVLWRRGNLDEAEDKLTSFLAAPAGAREQVDARRVLANIERRKRERQDRQEAAQQTSPAEISSPPDAGPDQ